MPGSGRSFVLGDFEAFIFDLDGVITRTARVHAEAWKRLFDEYLREQSARTGEEFSPFDIDTDYPKHLDGMPRYDGVRNFLRSRGIDLPEGTPQDPPERETVFGLGNRKNRYFHEALEQQKPEVFESTVEFIHQLKARNIRVAVISSSKNCVPVLEQVGLLNLFDAKVDGIDSEELGITGKPAPDIFLEAARRLGTTPAVCAVVEDAVAGVRAASDGGFRFVFGVDRIGQGDALVENGADLVVRDLSEIVIRKDLD